MAHLLRLMTWNIAEGLWNAGPNERIPDLARKIQSFAPDVVMLSEVFDYSATTPLLPDRSQLRILSDRTRLPHIQFANTAWVIKDGAWKTVAVMSRHPLGPVTRYELPEGYAFMLTSAVIAGVTHWIVSLRFRHDTAADLRLGCQMLGDVAEAKEAPLVAGGDFNCGPGFPAFERLFNTRPYSFVEDRRLKAPDPPVSADTKDIDHILFRGTYQVLQTRRPPHGSKLVGTNIVEDPQFPSDHPLLASVLSSTQETVIVRMGDTVAVRHRQTHAALRSDELHWAHPRSSGQQAVTAQQACSDNELWRFVPRNGVETTDVKPEPILDGDVVRMQHLATKRNLHSHTGFPCPISSGQEVSCFGRDGRGDGNDNWTVEVADQGTLRLGTPFRLVHGTGVALASSRTSGAETFFHQEVRGESGTHADQDWYVYRVHSPTTTWEGSKGNRVALRSFNATNYYIGFRDFLGIVGPVLSGPDQIDPAFEMVLGLARTAAVSLKSPSFADHYIRHQNFELKLHKNTGTVLFQRDATFVLREGLADPNGFSLESVNYPGRFIRHKDYRLYLDEPGPDPFNADATYYLEDAPVIIT